MHAHCLRRPVPRPLFLAKTPWEGANLTRIRGLGTEQFFIPGMPWNNARSERHLKMRFSLGIVGGVPSPPILVTNRVLRGLFAKTGGSWYGILPRIRGFGMPSLKTRLSSSALYRRRLLGEAVFLAKGNQESCGQNSRSQFAHRDRKPNAIDAPNERQQDNRAALEHQRAHERDDG